MLFCRNEHVKDSAAHSELTASVDQIDSRVSSLGKRAHRIVEHHLIALSKNDWLNITDAADNRLQQSTDGGHYHANDAFFVVCVARVTKSAENRGASTHRVDSRREALVRQRLPRRKLCHRLRWQQRTQRRHEVL